MASISKRTYKRKVTDPKTGKSTWEPTGTGWQVRYRDPLTGRRIAKSFKRLRDAEAWLAAQSSAIVTGTHVDPMLTSRPFGELVESWKSGWNVLEPKTRAGYESILRKHLMPAFGKRRVGDVTTVVVQAWANEMVEKGAAPDTVRNAVGALRSCYSAGVRLGLVRTNPTTGVRLPKPPHREMLFLTAEEVGALLDALDPYWRPLVATAVYGGLRIGEIGGLRRGDLDLRPGKATLRVEQSVKEISGQLIYGPPKTARSRRTVALPGFLADALRGVLAELPPDPAGLVFVTPRGAPLRPNLWYKRVFKPAVLAALPPSKHGLRFHDLRHTAVALLIDAGEHPKAIADRMGHANIGITMDTYGHLMPSADAALAARLDAAHAPTAEPAPKPDPKVIPLSRQRRPRS